MGTTSDKNSLIAVLDSAGVIQIFDRNGLSPEEAVAALLDAGLLATPKFGDKHLKIRVFPAHPDLRVHGVVKAPERANLTKQATREKILEYCSILGHSEADSVVPPTEADARVFLKQLAFKYRLWKKSGLIRATDAQVSFAKKLAKIHCIELPLDRSRKSIEAFISMAKALPPKATEAQSALIYALNKQCSDLPFYLPIEFPEQLLLSDAQQFIADWIGFSEPRPNALHRAKSLSLLTDVPIFSQFGRITQNSCSLYNSVVSSFLSERIVGKYTSENVMAVLKNQDQKQLLEDAIVSAYKILQDQEKDLSHDEVVEADEYSD